MRHISTSSSSGSRFSTALTRRWRFCVAVLSIAICAPSVAGEALYTNVSAELYPEDAERNAVRFGYHFRSLYCRELFFEQPGTELKPSSEVTTVADGGGLEVTSSSGSSLGGRLAMTSSAALLELERASEQTPAPEQEQNNEGGTLFSRLEYALWGFVSQVNTRPEAALGLANLLYHYGYWSPKYPVFALKAAEKFAESWTEDCFKRNTEMRDGREFILQEEMPVLSAKCASASSSASTVAVGGKKCFAGGDDASANAASRGRDTLREWSAELNFPVSASRSIVAGGKLVLTCAERARHAALLYANSGYALQRIAGNQIGIQMDPSHSQAAVVYRQKGGRILRELAMWEVAAGVSSVVAGKEQRQVTRDIDAMGGSETDGREEEHEATLLALKKLLATEIFSSAAAEARVAGQRLRKSAKWSTLTSPMGSVGITDIDCAQGSSMLAETCRLLMEQAVCEVISTRFVAIDFGTTWKPTFTFQSNNKIIADVVLDARRRRKDTAGEDLPALSLVFGDLVAGERVTRDVSKAADVMFTRNPILHSGIANADLKLLSVTFDCPTKGSLTS
ncbi:unnamed protein product [Amoebophrya sp. A25]|nr:unnamed protein product [Amoebophrya sp. A25]|eukprot:GSA25T00000794001.1